VTIDLDTTDVEVYGRHKRGVAFNHQGQRCGRPHVASWAETATVLAAELMAGNQDPRGHAAQLLRRALAALPAAARAGRIRLRADAGYFAGSLARAALVAQVEFAIGAKRIAPCGASWTASPRATGPTRSTWMAPRSRWPSTARTGGLWRPGC
jgi:DDE family transposase